MVRKIGVQSQLVSHQRLKKWYLMPTCLILKDQGYGGAIQKME